MTTASYLASDRSPANQPKAPISLLRVALVLPILITINACSVARLQAGLELPTPEVVAAAANETGQDQVPPPIGTYQRFSIAAEAGIDITVYAREIAGARANVLMIHGAGSGAWAWEYFFALMPKSYNLYALSWRGHFDSSPVEDAHAQDYVNDQQAVMKWIDLRNRLPVHLVGHSYGGATSVLQFAQSSKRIASITLLAPVVPLDYTTAQRIVVPMLAPPFIRRSLRKGNDTNGVYGGMFLSKPRMHRYFDRYAGKPYSTEKPGLIAGDGVSAKWQEELSNAYES